MSLAETASTFCETFIRKAAVEEGSDAEKLLILEAALQGENQVVVDISSRFLFEKRALELRKKGELSATDYCDIMREAQHETYGDGLDSDQLHPYMWAAKPHYYGSDFYNFPYMFGLLFGIGLYAEGLARPEGFTGRYAELLSDTGRFDAATLAGRFGIDIRTSQFWDASLGQIADDVSKFEKIVHSIG